MTSRHCTLLLPLQLLKSYHVLISTALLHTCRLLSYRRWNTNLGMHRFRPKRWLLAAAPILALLILGDEKPATINPNERVLLVTAHPDDECFFFGPTLLGLSSQTDSLFSLTVSNGNNDGLGLSREPELRSSLAILGVPPERSFLLSHPLLQDNFTQVWDSNVIIEAILPYVLDHRITTILTFDRLGISSHPNHYSLFYGVQHLLVSAPFRRHQLRAYALVTEPLLIKYSGWLGLLSRWIFYRHTSKGDATSLGLPARRYTSGLPSYLITFYAMTQHRSQMVWFRWLYLFFSRYLWVNDWVEIEAAS